MKKSISHSHSPGVIPTDMCFQDKENTDIARTRKQCKRGRRFLCILCELSCQKPFRGLCCVGTVAQSATFRLCWYSVSCLATLFFRNTLRVVGEMQHTDTQTLKWTEYIHCIYNGKGRSEQNCKWHKQWLSILVFVSHTLHFNSATISSPFRYQWLNRPYKILLSTSTSTFLLL